MKKRIVCMLLALLLLVGMLPVGVFAEGKTEYEKNETGTAVFNSVLSGQIAYVSDDPTLGWNSSADYNITVDAALLSQTFTIADSYVGESGYWYKLAPIGEEAMPAKLSAKPWVFQNDITSSGNADALIITPPANTCRCCESCTGAEDCECGCGECDYCEPVTTDPTTPTDPSQPECGCCDACINTEGCTCGCENCQFCEPEAPEDPEIPTVTDETTGAKVYVETLPEGVKLAVDTDVDGSALLSDFRLSDAQLVFAWDISLRNADNTEYQPGSGAMVKIPVNAAAGTKIGLLHKHSGGTSFMGVTEVLPDGTIEFYTDSFSEFAGFTVDFHYNGVDFSIPGLSEIRLSELFEIMEIEENAFEATSVVFSDNSLIGVQQQADGDWLLTSLESFTTNETLVITFTDGHTIVIDVTDVIYYEGTNGSTYTVPYWNIDSEGVVRISINYDNVPMTIYLYKESVASLSWDIVSGGSYIDTSGKRTLQVDIKNNIPIKSNAVDIDLNPGGRVHLDVYRYIDITYEYGGKTASNKPNNVTDKKITTSTNNYTVSSTVPTATGYTFDYWQGSNGVQYSPGATASLTSNTTLTAVWKANTNTAYKVETYTQNIADNNYTKVTENNTGTTGTTASVTPAAPTGFTYNASKSTVSGTIAGDGSLVLKVYYDRNSYTVTTNAGTGISAVSGGGTYKYGATVPINATVSDGYKWKNWTGHSTQTTKNYSFTMPASNVTYTANAEKISYNVTFDMQGATSSSIANKTLTWDEQYTLPTPEKKYTVTYDHNYAVSGTQVKTSDTAQATFLGWADQGAIVFGGKTYSYNGSEADRTKFDAPFYVQPFAVPDKSKDVYNAAGFGGGHYNKYGLLKHFVNHGVTEYYTNGSPERKPAPTGDEEPGRYPIGAVVSNLSTTDGYSVPLIAGWSDVSSVTLPTPTRTGYTFGGWYTDAACSAAKKVTGTTYTPTSDVTLYAKWTPDTREVTYKYEGTVPSGAPAAPAKANVMPGTSTKVAEVPSLAGYTFSGWNTSDATVSKGSFTMPDKAVTFTGDWAENTYNISYDLDEGELDGNDENPATYQADSANFTLHNPKKDGYEFTGWTESISTTNWTNGFINLDTGACETYNAGYPNSVYSEKIFLEAGVTYKLEGTNLNGIRWRYFDTNGNFLGNKSLDDTFTPDVDGYVQILLYEGCTEANRNAAKITSSQGTTVLVKTGSTGDRAYTANWSVNTYTITYDLDDGERPTGVTSNTQSYNVEQPVTLMAMPTKEGYKFTGWELEDDVTEPDGNWKADTYSAAQEFKKGQYGHITLVAQWEEQYRYVLNFDANGGSGAPASITKKWCDDKEHTFTWTEAPTRTGYTFMGWAENATSEENVAGADKNSIKLDGKAAETVSKTIFAIWKRDTGTISLNYSGDVPVVVTVTCTDAVNDEEKITINTVVTSNTTIKDLPTGTYEVTAESGNANYTASVTPGGTQLEAGGDAVFNLSVSARGFNWKTGFAHVINKRGG